MESVLAIFHQLLHLDIYLGEVVQRYGTASYGLLFAIVFCETGLVVTPILPGDTLLFAAGAFAVSGIFSMSYLIPCLVVAAVLGDAANYAIGSFVGPKVWTSRSRLLKKEHLERTQIFFERYGGKTIILARFVPIVRTFAPFLAGVGRMSYLRFAAFNVLGALLWVLGCLSGGYFFGNLPFVKKNFTLVVLGIVFVSVLPALFEYFRQRAEGSSGRKSDAARVTGH